MAVVRGWGRGDGELVFNRHIVFQPGEMKTVLESVGRKNWQDRSRKTPPPSGSQGNRRGRWGMEYT